jgi:hypothetical protein
MVLLLPSISYLVEEGDKGDKGSNLPFFRLAGFFLFSSKVVALGSAGLLKLPPPFS